LLVPHLGGSRKIGNAERRKRDAGTEGPERKIK
jgi:hypothetical protein